MRRIPVNTLALLLAASLVPAATRAQPRGRPLPEAPPPPVAPALADEEARQRIAALGAYT